MCCGLLRGGQDLPQPREFFVAGEVDRDLAVALGGLAEIHLRAKGGAELLFKRGDLLVARAGTGRELPSASTIRSWSPSSE